MITLIILTYLVIALVIAFSDKEEKKSFIKKFGESAFILLIISLIILGVFAMIVVGLLALTLLLGLAHWIYVSLP